MKNRNKNFSESDISMAKDNYEDKDKKFNRNNCVEAIFNDKIFNQNYCITDNMKIHL